MAFIVETGQGLLDSNSYTSLEFADEYHANENLNSDDWIIGYTLEKKQAALIMASRILDDNYNWHGFIEHQEQALQWPRYTDSLDSVYLRYYNYQREIIPSGSVPLEIKKSTSELARLLLKSDRLSDKETGLKSVNVGVYIEFDKHDRIPVIPKYIRNMLRKIGNYSNNNIRIVRT